MSVSRSMIEKVPRLLLPLSPSSHHNNHNNSIIQSDSEKKKRNANSLYDNLYSPRTEVTDMASPRLSDGDINTSSSRNFYDNTNEVQVSISSDTRSNIPRNNSLIEFIHRTGSIDEYQHGFHDSPVNSPRSGLNSPRNVMSRSSRAQNCPHLAAPSPVTFPIQSHTPMFGSSSASIINSNTGAIDAIQLEASLQKASLSLLQSSMDELDVDDDSVPLWDQWNDTDDRETYRETYSYTPRLSCDDRPSNNSVSYDNVLEVVPTVTQHFSPGHK